MPYAQETFAGSAGVATYAFGAGTGSLTGGLKFLSSAHLTVKVNGVAQSFTVDSGHLHFTITGVTIAGGEVILVQRATPATEAGRLVQFTDLGYLRQRDLDRNSLQLLYLIQENLDVVAAVTYLQLSGVTNQWDALSKRIENVANATGSADAINKSQLDASSIAAGNLPVVSSADNDKSLFVVAGAWAIRTPAQARVHLGLGTAAVLNVGTGANQVVQLDGSARYPAVDGRNIDLSNNAVQTAIDLRYRTTVGHLRNTTEQTLTNDTTATWSQNASSILTLGALVSLDNSGDISVAANVVTLAAGTWEISYLLRVYNANATANNDQILKLKATDEQNGAGQVVYDAEYDTGGGIDIKAAGSTNKGVYTVGNTLLLKLAAGGKVTIRAVDATAASTDIKVPGLTLICRKVSTSTA